MTEKGGGRATTLSSWEKHHPPPSSSSSSLVPSRLYTDENPATTIKGLGFRNRFVAERTIRLTSQPGVRYKQYWTIKSMRERAFHHPHPTKDMKEALQVFDQWLNNNNNQSSDERSSFEQRKQRQEEWKEYRRLCKSSANVHAYGKDPTPEELTRARRDVEYGRKCLLEGLEQQVASQPTRTNTFIKTFPMASFTALFGGPGMHGYGNHTIIRENEVDQSQIVIEGKQGLEELVPSLFNRKKVPANIYSMLTEEDESLLGSIQISYHHQNQTATILINFSKGKRRRRRTATLKELWSNNNNNKMLSPPPKTQNQYNKHNKNEETTTSTAVSTSGAGISAMVEDHDTSATSSWTCNACTFVHCGISKQMFLTCEICGTKRSTTTTTTATYGTTTTTTTTTFDKKMSTTKKKKMATATTKLVNAKTNPQTTATNSSPSLSRNKTTTNHITKTTTAAKTTTANEKRPYQPSSSAETLARKKQATTTTTTTKTSELISNNLKRPCPSSISSASAAAAAWGSLRPPSQKDIVGRYKRQKALDAPIPLMDYLILLDFEWTADNTRKMIPIPEITQFPSVVMKLVQKKKGIPIQVPSPSATTATNNNNNNNNYNIPIPSPPFISLDLTMPSNENFLTQDAFAISAFDTYVKPTYNPQLTPFSIQLTAITQSDVDAAPTIEIVLEQYMQWLLSLDLVVEEEEVVVDSNNNDQKVLGNHHRRFRKKGNWCFVTWGDVDIMSVLRQELQYKSIVLPSCFDKWINLKSDSMFKKHYGVEPRGGLRTCVESVVGKGAWEGRAHNGFVDSINTAKIVRHMTQTGFRFVRSTRGIGKDGIPFGQKKD